MSTPSIFISTLLFLFLFLSINIPSSSSQNALGHCSGTLYPDLCASTIANIPNADTKPLTNVISTAINRTESNIGHSKVNFRKLLRRLASRDGRQRIAISDCLELLDQTVTDLRRAVKELKHNASSNVDNLKTVLSAAITNQYTCLDGFAFVDDSQSLRPLIENQVFYISRLVSNSLAMAKKIQKKKEKKKKHGKNEILEGYGRIVKGFPTWLSREDQEVLGTNDTEVDLVVAKDGSGNFTTINEALQVVPNNSAARFVIYIKQGAYFENVEVVSSKTNLMFLGDGIGKTVIKASRNVVDGWTTYRSATVAVVGNGFIGRDLTIENAAGPDKHQAVALRSNSDFSAFYRCSFVGYQDTLYTHSQRQFYKECDVYGTVDFIFGNSAVVFQNCNLYARKPSVNQKNIFTAQGREDPNQNTGISIQSCKIAAAADLLPVLSEFQSYLGRPWKNYSRTVIMQSKLESLIDPAGWLEWDGDFALSTLVYREYMNRGPGSNTSERVTWPGYGVISNFTEADKYTVDPFIQGSEWLGLTAIPFSSGLTS